MLSASSRSSPWPGGAPTLHGHTRRAQGARERPRAGEPRLRQRPPGRRPRPGGHASRPRRCRRRFCECCAPALWHGGSTWPAHCTAQKSMFVSIAGVCRVSVGQSKTRYHLSGSGPAASVKTRGPRRAGFGVVRGRNPGFVYLLQGRGFHLTTPFFIGCLTTPTQPMRPRSVHAALICDGLGPTSVAGVTGSR